MNKMTLDEAITRLNTEYPEGKNPPNVPKYTRSPLLQEADALAAAEGKKVWLGVDGWYADLPENERGVERG